MTTVSWISRGHIVWVVFAVLVLGALLYAIMSLAGCEADAIVSGYGQRRGAELQESVNGTSALSRLFEQAGHKVATWRRLSPRIRSFDTLVWFPDLNGAPSQREREFLDAWLDDNPGRTLVYVGRDYDNASLYWRKMKAAAPADQIGEIETRLTSAREQHDFALANGAHLSYSRWFTVRTGPHYPVVDVRGPWAEGIDDGAIEISVGTRLLAAESGDQPVVGQPTPTFTPLWLPVEKATNAAGSKQGDATTADSPETAKTSSGSKSSEASTPSAPATPTGGANAPGAGQSPKSATTPTAGTPPPTGTPPAPRTRGRRRAGPNTLFGPAQPVQAEPERRPIPNSETLLETDRGDPLVRRVYDGVRPFVNPSVEGRRSQVIVVTNGAFLLNMGLVNREHRKLAARLVAECGPPGNVAFLESGPTGLAVLDKEPQNTMPSGMGLFTIYPLNILLLHLIGFGLLFCFTAWPIFGRAKRLPTTTVSDFGAHVEAFGELLERTRDRKTARLIFENYQKLSKETR